jgi:hypothetical protein
MEKSLVVGKGLMEVRHRMAIVASDLATRLDRIERALGEVLSLQGGAPKDAARSLPFRYRNGRIYGLQSFLDLRARPTACKVFRLFLRSKGFVAPEGDLLKEIYGVNPALEASDRRVMAAKDALIKMLSRLRVDAEKAFGGEDSNIDWFLYDSSTASYALYAVRSSGSPWAGELFS